MRTLWLSLALAASAAAQVRFEDILKGPGDNWLTYAGDYRGQRHSALKQINTSNAASLVPKWTYHVPKASGLRTNPIVHDGIMYITAPNEIRALDARSGRLIWAFKDPKSKKEAVNRGAAIMGDKVYFVTTDIYLVALDRRTGAVLWSKKYGEVDDGMVATSAPLVVKDKILVGTAGGDTGMRGYVAALHAET
ncbi:MAG: PQQ-binding-like beta-propeller repeat protein, partial [Bryobacterales bacterium]|nr:PQQ-binding-like beta-propeller repeat protein [Bryobacterales bacterium]